MTGAGLLQSWRALAAQRMRTLLTLLGIIIASGSLVLLVALLRGGEAALQRAAQEATESDLIEVRASEAPARLQGRAQRALSRWDERSLELSPSLRGAWVGTEQGHDAAAHFEGRKKNVTVVSATPEALALYRLSLAQGRFLDDTDRFQVRRVCVLGDEIWRELLKGAPLTDQSIRIDGERWSVVGVLRDKPTLGGNIGTHVWNRKVLVPETSFDIAYNTEHAASRLFVRASDPGVALEPLRAATLSALLRRHFGIRNFSFRDPEGDEQARLIFTIAKALLLSTSLISLLVGGINVMNVMLVTVTERRKEIGIRRAVGASPSVIRNHFVLEAVLLTGIGGLLGVLFGVLLALLSTWLLRSLLGAWTLFIEPWAAAAGFGASLMTGVAFGLYPAARAAEVDVIDALRAE